VEHSQQNKAATEEVVQRKIHFVVLAKVKQEFVFALFRRDHFLNEACAKVKYKAQEAI
jgi:hypothetical protein